MIVKASPPVVQVHSVTTGTGGVLLSISTTDPRRAGGHVLLTTAALRALPAVLAEHIADLDQEAAA